MESMTTSGVSFKLPHSSSAGLCALLARVRCGIGPQVSINFQTKYRKNSKKIKNGQSYISRTIINIFRRAGSSLTWDSPGMQGGTDKLNCPCQRAATFFSVILAHITGRCTVESQKLKVSGLHPPRDMAESHWFL